MMSLTKVNNWKVIQKQYLFKLKAYSGVFTSLMLVQMIAFLFSFGGTGGSGSSSSTGYSVEADYYTGGMVIGFTILWAFITAILITTKAYRNDDFTFVTNRATSNVSNILFLVTTSVVGAVTSVLLGYLLKIFVYFTFDVDLLLGTSTSLSQLLTGLIAAFLYILLFAGGGYLVGIVAQISKVLLIIIAAIFFGYPMYANERETFVLKIIEFFQAESSLAIFMIKVILTVSLLFLASSVFTNRMEVRQ